MDAANTSSGMQNDKAVLEKFDSLLPNHTLTKPSSNSTSRYLPDCIETYTQTKICTQMFIADLFIITSTWRHPRCTSTGKWINSGTTIQ